MNDFVGPFLLALLDCVYLGVDHTGDLAIARKCLVPGDIAWDNCDCGQLVMSENRRYGSRIFATEAPDLEAECGEPVLTIDVTLGIQRCLPGPNDNGDPPSCAALNTATLQMLKDKNDIRRTLMCCLTATYDSHNTRPQLIGFIIQAQETTGPTGMCGGSDTNFLVGFPNGCDC